MRNPSKNLWLPDKGYKYISNGEIWTDSIYLGATDSVENWHDTNEEPPAPQEPDKDATSDDYESALNRLGVET